MRPKPKIELCLASQHFYPTHGGAQLRFLRYLPGLRERGVHTRVLSGTPKKKKLVEADRPSLQANAPAVKNASAEPIDGIPVHRVQLPNRAGWHRSIVFNQALLNYCRQPDYRPDVVQVVSSLQPRSLPWVLRLQRLGIPVVYAYTIPVTLPKNPVKRAIRRWHWRLLYRHVDCMVVGSGVMRDLAMDIGVQTRFEVIPNGVNLERFRPAHDQAERLRLRRSLGVEDHQNMISLVAAVHPRKGTDLLLDAWCRLLKQFPQTHVFLVGLRKDLQYPKLSDFRDRLQRLITASGAADFVHFTDTVRNPEEYLRASDVFVFPSEREGLPNAVLEAMATGLPVVLTPFIGLSEDLGQPDRDYLLADRDPRALARAIARVLENENLRGDLGRNGRRWVQQTMDLERSLDRYAQMYLDLAASARSRHRQSH